MASLQRSKQPTHSAYSLPGEQRTRVEKCPDNFFRSCSNPRSSESGGVVGAALITRSLFQTPGAGFHCSSRLTRTMIHRNLPGQDRHLPPLRGAQRGLKPDSRKGWEDVAPYDQLKSTWSILGMNDVTINTPDSSCKVQSETLLKKPPGPLLFVPCLHARNDPCINQGTKMLV